MKYIKKCIIWQCWTLRTVISWMCMVKWGSYKYIREWISLKNRSWHDYNNFEFSVVVHSVWFAFFLNLPFFFLSLSFSLSLSFRVYLCLSFYDSQNKLHSGCCQVEDKCYLFNIIWTKVNYSQTKHNQNNKSVAKCWNREHTKGFAIKQKQQQWKS